MSEHEDVKIRQVIGQLYEQIQDVNKRLKKLEDEWRDFCYALAEAIP